MDYRTEEYERQLEFERRDGWYDGFFWGALVVGFLTTAMVLLVLAVSGGCS